MLITTRKNINILPYSEHNTYHLTKIAIIKRRWCKKVFPKSESCAKKCQPDHRVRFDKRWMIRHQAYDRSISELTRSKMKCTLGDLESDPNAL